MGNHKLLLFGVLFVAVMLSFQNCGNVNLKTPEQVSSSYTPSPSVEIDPYIDPFVNCSRSWKTSAVFDTRTGSDYGVSAAILKDKIIIYKALQNQADLYSPTVIMKSYDVKTGVLSDFFKNFSNVSASEKCYLNKIISDKKTVLAGIGTCQISASMNYTYVFTFDESTNTWVKNSLESAYSLTIDSKSNLWVIQGRWNSGLQKYFWDIYKKTVGSSQWTLQASSDLDSGYVPSLVISKKDEIYVTSPKLTRTGPMHFHIVHVKSGQTYPIMEQLMMRSDYEKSYNYYQKGDTIYFTFMKSDSSAKVVEFDFEKLSTRVVGDTLASVAQPIDVARRSNNTLLMWSYIGPPDFTEFKTSDLSLVSSSSLNFNLNSQPHRFATIQTVTHDNGDIFIIGSGFYQNYNSVVRAFTCN